ncbi:MAG: hypothetical protein CMO05_06340 [Thalassospira sp.]|uniref:hypothetical protein n=1 Tax=Thalassospira sp. GB04J01 TaxID=1485225 RepID=UPI000C0D498E|nr:hypothetical protein [Thalassospira sp. GB04J01]MBV17080.1 hypothetical protein [Thalassospira sp.]
MRHKKAAGKRQLLNIWVFAGRASIHHFDRHQVGVRKFSLAVRADVNGSVQPDAMKASSCWLNALLVAFAGMAARV